MALSEKYHEAVRKTMDEDLHRSEELKLEEMLLAGVRSERGMEIGSKEWNEFRERLRFRGREESNNKKASKHVRWGNGR